MASSFYTRTCVKCGDTAKVTYKPKPGSKCLKCAAGENAYAMSQARRGQITRYTRTCEDCGDVKTDCKAKPKSPQLCASCSRRRVGNSNTGRRKPDAKSKHVIKVPKPKIRYFRVCQVCDDVKQVGSKAAAAKNMCTACSHKANGKKRIGKKFNKVAPAMRKIPKPSKRKVSKEAIEKARQLNLAHREQEAKKPRKPKQTKSEEQMISEWLAKNEVEVVGSTTPLDSLHIYSGIGGRQTGETYE